MIKDTPVINEVSIEAPAKINLFLEILGKRDDGYHEIETVMQEIDITDLLRFKEIEEGVRLECEDNSIPLNEDNLVYKAAKLIQRECGIKKGALIRLEKRIPVGAGLGGGSSDAAATLKALNLLWKIGLSDAELVELASKLGSDVAFFIEGKTSLCKGRGEKVYPIESNSKLNYIVIFPNINVSTKAIYENVRLDLTKKRKDVSFLKEELRSSNAFSLGKLLFNRLEETIFAQYPDLRKIKDSLKCFGFRGILVSGSGSSIFGLCSDWNQAKVIRNEIDARGFGKVFVATSVTVPQVKRQAEREDL